MKQDSRISKCNELYGPLIYSIIVTIILSFLLRSCESLNIFSESFTGTFDKILDSTIVFASIIVGFTGVLMGILFSISEKRLMRKFFKTRAKKDLKSYFARNISSGMLLVLSSMALYLREYIPCNIIMTFVYVWIFLLLYVFLSAYRIISIMMHILFASNDEDETKEPEGKKMDDDKVRELEKAHAK